MFFKIDWLQNGVQGTQMQDTVGRILIKEQIFIVFLIDFLLITD